MLSMGLHPRCKRLPRWVRVGKGGGGAGGPRQGQSAPEVSARASTLRPAAGGREHQQPRARAAAGAPQAGRRHAADSQLEQSEPASFPCHAPLSADTRPFQDRALAGGGVRGRPKAWTSADLFWREVQAFGPLTPPPASARLLPLIYVASREDRGYTATRPKSQRGATAVQPLCFFLLFLDGARLESRGRCTVFCQPAEIHPPEQKDLSKTESGR